MSAFHGKSTAYIPPFLWRLWLSDLSSDEPGHRLHIYNVDAHTITEEHRLPVKNNTVFQGLKIDGVFDDEVEMALESMEKRFAVLEEMAESTLGAIVSELSGLSAPIPSEGVRPKIALSRTAVDALRKYLVFVRFRNGSEYQRMVESVQRSVAKAKANRNAEMEDEAREGRVKKGPIRTADHPARLIARAGRRDWFRAVQRLRARDSRFHALSPMGAQRTRLIDRFLHVQCFTSVVNFLEHDPHYGHLSENMNVFDDEHLHCRNLGSAEVCVGLAADGHEFVFTDDWYYALVDDADTFHHYVFPLTPKVALYLVVDSTAPSAPRDTSPPYKLTLEHLEYEIESPSDVQQRNEMSVHRLHPRPHSRRPSPSSSSQSGSSTQQGLDTDVQHIYFSSSQAMVKSIVYYDERVQVPGSNPDNLDYGLLNRFRMLCRNEAILEGLRKTLCLRGSIYVTDLTDEVVRMGDSAVGLGSFSDVWKGVWSGGLRPSSTGKFVAVKVLRQVMAQNHKNKVMSSLKDEILVWHGLRHPHIQPLHGVMQLSGTLAMVSPWRDSGTITHYLNSVNPSADRLALLTQVASGLTYLHGFQPIVIHGDLKGGNILIDDNGAARISDFGLSRVVEDMHAAPGAAPSSFFAGSTRWMAPELVFALVEDTSGVAPPITVPTDVYAFGSVVLEVATGQSPYPECRNEHAVTVAILRDVKPCQGADLSADALGGTALGDPTLWAMVERCWAKLPQARPKMGELLSFLQELQIQAALSIDVLDLVPLPSSSTSGSSTTPVSSASSL